MGSIKSVLKMNKLIFDKIKFERTGFKNSNQLSTTLEAHFAQNLNEEMHRVTLILKGEKKEEYNFEIEITGYFSFEGNGNNDEDFQDELIRRNAVSIMMPYLRSEVSLLTAQPDVDCVVLQPFNINGFIDEENEKTK